MSLPALFAVKQKFTATCIDDVPGAVRSQFARLGLAARVKPGQSVAVTVGSRGISHLVEMVATSIACLRELGLKPFVMPAMGSHGGATAPGQTEILANLGITRDTVGAPIVSHMEVVPIGVVDSGAEILLAKDALAADHLMVINRVKPHTAFRSEVESGLCKMLTIGCGKHLGAVNVHKYALGKTIIPGARLVMQKMSVLCGLAVVESPDHGIHQLSLVGPQDIEATDREMLKVAWTMLPRIPVDALDFLVVEEIGKNISGAGMDPNVTGLWRREGGERKPDFRILAVLGITPQSHGNGMGLGMADLITDRVRDMLDIPAMRTNALTSGVLRSALIPMSLENDRILIETVLHGLLPHPETARIGRIRNTMAMDKMWFSASVLPELRHREGIVVEDEPLAWSFDENNRLLNLT